MKESIYPVTLTAVRSGAWGFACYTRRYR